MHTEFPRSDISRMEKDVATVAALAASSMHDCALATSRAVHPDVSEDDQTIVDLRYEQLLARAELEHLMDDL